MIPLCKPLTSTITVNIYALVLPPSQREQLSCMKHSVLLLLLQIFILSLKYWVYKLHFFYNVYTECITF